EAGLAGDGSAVDRPCNVAGDAARHARVINDGDVFRRRHLARVDPAHGSFARFAADVLRLAQFREIEAGIEVVVALHLRAFAGNDADGTPEAAGAVGAGEAVRGGEHQP